MTVQPELGIRLQAIREQAKDGKRMSRQAFATMIGMSATQINNIEKGRKLKDGELDILLQHYPELGAAAFEPDQPASNADRAANVLEDPAQVELGVGQHQWDERDQHWQEVDAETTAQQEPGTSYGDLVALSEEEVLEYEIEFDLLPRSGVSESTPLLGVADAPFITEEQLRDTIGMAPAAVPTIATPENNVATDGTLFVSNSEVQTFKRCRRKWWLKWYRNLEVKVEDPTGARALGNRVHRALKALYVPAGQTPQDPRDALERAITDDWTKLTKAVAEQGWGEPPATLVDQFQKDTSLERAMVEGYVEWLAETGADRGLEVVAPETYVEVDLEVPGPAGRPTKLIGKLDVRLIRESDGVRLFMDHKSVGDLTRPVKTVHIDEQMLHYHLIEWLKFLQGEEEMRCDGAIYNMLRKVKRTAKANPPFYGRVEVRHNERELTSFRTRLIGTIQQMAVVRDRLDAGEDPLLIVFPTPTSNCSWDCDFFAVCPMFDDGSRVEDALEAQYRVANPLGYYATPADEE